MFAPTFGFSDAVDFRDDVLEVLMAVAILHYDDMRKLAPDGPYITRIKHASSQLSITEMKERVVSLKDSRAQLTQRAHAPHTV